MTLMRIRMDLGRSDGFPDGSRRHGYEFVAPLTREWRIDAAAWRAVKAECTVRRFWGDEADEFGHLRHLGHGWRFDYGEPGPVDDEPFFKLDNHVVAPGTYVSVTEHDGIQRPFRIVRVIPLHEIVSPPHGGRGADISAR